MHAVVTYNVNCTDIGNYLLYSYLYVICIIIMIIGLFLFEINTNLCFLHFECECETCTASPNEIKSHYCFSDEIENIIRRRLIEHDLIISERKTLDQIIMTFFHFIKKL